MRETAPPEASGRSSGDGVQVRHANRKLRQGLAAGQPAFDGLTLASRMGIWAAALGERV
jgi:hypothetical protein